MLHIDWKFVCLLCVTFGTTSDLSLAASTDIKEARKQAAQRVRHILFNDDGSYNQAYDTPDKFLSLRLCPAVEAAVDTIFYCTGNTTIFRGHCPQVGEMHGELVPLSQGESDRIKLESIRALNEVGHDQLSLACAYCRENNVEIFFSMRMNDLHDVLWELRRSRWKRDHLDYCLGKPEDRDKYPATDPHHWWTALDYEQPEVRDYIFRILEDVCTRYDIDGIELDWWRMPILFRPSLEFKSVEARQVTIINMLMERVRAMTDRVGQQRGRPLLITCRVPLGAARSHAIGLDVETWLEDDLVDLLVLGGGYAPMAMAPQVREMVRLGHRFGVQVYPCISGSGLKAEYDSPEAARAVALNIWQAGGDGVYLFNIFPEQGDTFLNKFSTPETLRGLQRVYAVDHFIPERFLGCYRPALVAPGRLPVTWMFGQAAMVNLSVGENILASAPEGKKVHSRLRLKLSNVLPGEVVKVTLNGIPLPATKPDKPFTTKETTAWYHLDVDPIFFRAGDNNVLVQLTAGNAVQADTNKSVTLERLDLFVKYLAADTTRRRSDNENPTTHRPLCTD